MKTEESIRLPEDFIEFDGDIIMSNFDGRINGETYSAIKGQPLFSGYTGWNFYGKVWWDLNLLRWCCEVWQYHCYKETVVCDTLEEIMSEVCSNYGHE